MAAVAAITRTGVGLFTIQFSEAWAQKYLDFNFYCQQAAYSAAYRDCGASCMRFSL